MRLSHNVQAQLSQLVHLEAVKVGRELIKAREDWGATLRHHEATGSEQSQRMRDNAVRLVEDLADEAREWLELARFLNQSTSVDLTKGE